MTFPHLYNQYPGTGKKIKGNYTTAKTIFIAYLSVSDEPLSCHVILHHIPWVKVLHIYNLTSSFTATPSRTMANIHFIHFAFIFSFITFAPIWEPMITQTVVEIIRGQLK
jgi:hypothetical protein